MPAKFGILYWMFGVGRLLHPCASSLQLLLTSHWLRARALSARWLWSVVRGLSFGHHRHKHVGNARRAHLTERGELVAIDLIEQENAAAEHLSFRDRLERARTRDMIRMDHHFNVARFEFFHRALENDPAAIDEDEIGQDILDFLHLMRRHHDGAIVIEVIVQQRIVELLPIYVFETKC